ncbi:hypothetical protein EK599_08290 [Vibrio sp. T187]|uniref:hypothetical protein n=1 Tax=Vibrio TaxID=662 RepID=UPI0010C97D3C|nr:MULTISPECIES: hypothetical protein [Vibrio]MBW3695692.1 hypothetical protein [Vibrio sp. T187]
MPISGVQSGYQLIQQSSKMAEEAALEANQAAQQEQERNDLSFNKIEPQKEEVKNEEKSSPPPASQTDALMKLNQSSSYNRIGASVVERNNEMIGSLLDIHI